MKRRNRWIGGLLGVAGGAVGLVAMKYAIDGAGRLLEQLGAKPAESARARSKRSISLIGTHHEPGESASAALGRIVYEKVLGKSPDRETREMISTGVHVGYGLLMAGLYGATRAGKGSVVLGGTAFAFGLWLLGDELVAPLLGLGDSPAAMPAHEHGKDLVGHLAYGVATALATQGLSRAIN